MSDDTEYHSEQIYYQLEAVDAKLKVLGRANAADETKKPSSGVLEASKAPRASPYLQR